MYRKFPVVILGMLLSAMTAATLGFLPVTAPSARWSVANGNDTWTHETTAQVLAAANSTDDANLLARVVAAEAQGEPHTGQVAVAAVILNRVRDARFPHSLSGVIFQPHAFESVSNGLIWRRSPDANSIAAARQALNGWDPTYGCVFFWNPAKPVSAWIWTRNIVARIGSHVFAK